VSQENTEQESLGTFNQINDLSAEFDQMCQLRHEKGAEDYGHLTFLENDTLRMLCEELIDAANYARYTYIRLRLYSEKFAGENPESQIGAKSFKGAASEWKAKE
jgi:hypothetical protein